MTKVIEEYCEANEIELAGKIAYDPIVTEALTNRKIIVEYSDRKVTQQIKDIWRVVSEAK
jgi:MinD superfamily P-loop ATPase